MTTGELFNKLESVNLSKAFDLFTGQMQKLLTLSEMAGRFSVSTKTFRKYVIEQKIPHHLIGRNMRFDPVTVEAFLTAKPKPAANVVKFKPSAKGKKLSYSRTAEAMGV